jgi:hypothetical protein
MSTVLEPHNALKRQVGLVILSLATLGASTATILHRLQPNPYPIDLIAPPVLAIASLSLFLRLYKKPESLLQVTHLALLGAVLFIVFPSWGFTLKAFASPSITLVGSLPPITSTLFLLTMLMLIYLRPQRVLHVGLVAWIFSAAPILTYLILHPTELITPRGLDLVISLGPAMGIQIVLLLFFNRLQNIVDRLYTERLQYYARIVERQTIWQQAMEQAFTQIHNGPLQTLTLLLRDVQRESVSSPQLCQRLEELNAEIRAVGHSLTDAPSLENCSLSQLAVLEPATSEHLLRLGEGTWVDLTRPLHDLLYEVYSLTLSRQLPYFQTIRVKVRDFSPLQNSSLTFDLKRDLCLWLEESLCNVGKHALGVTRIVVTGTYREGQYILKVQDNGSGLKPSQDRQGTKQSSVLAQRLGGQFRRESLPEGGTICELSWSVESGNSLI